MPGTTWTRWCSCRWMAVVVYSEGVVWTSYSLVRKNDINIITSRYRWSERLVAGDFGDRDICTISETGQKVQPQKSVSFKLYLFQDAEILLSIIASTLKGKRGNDSEIENLTMEDFNRVERLVLEDVKSRSWPILQSDTFNMWRRSNIGESGT